MNTPKSIEEALAQRKNGSFNYNCMVYVAINMHLELLQTLFDWALEDNIQTIKVPAWEKSFVEYLSDGVLCFVWNNYCSYLNLGKYRKDVKGQIEKEKFQNILNFVQHVRTQLKEKRNEKLNWNPVISRVISEGWARDTGASRETLGLLFEFADEEGFCIDFQKHLKNAISRCEKITPFLYECAKKRGFALDWMDLAKSTCDIRNIVKWAKADEFRVVVNCQKYLEDCAVIQNADLVRFYLDMAKAEDQSLDFAKFLELSQSKDIAQLIQEYIPKSYKLPEYPKELNINLKTMKTSNGIDLDGDYVMDDLYQFAMKTSSIRNIKYRGKRYYERSSSWGGGICPGKRPRHDPDIECGSYTECDAPPTIFPDDDSEVIYNLEYFPQTIYWNDEQFHNHALIRQLQHVPIEKILLSGYSGIILNNNSGPNDDHRGSNHCQVDLEFHYSYLVPLPCPLERFIKACYRVKSHKWDKWYELFVGATHNVQSNMINVDLSFDHGS